MEKKTPEENEYAVRIQSRPDRLWKKNKPLLPAIDIELTERCNNNCIHCCINLPENDKQAIQRELSTSEWKGILDQAAHLGALTVRFTGGEPLLRHDFVELYLYARRLGLRVLLFTNGRLITPELAELFARCPPLEEIEITVYGMNSGSYESVTRTKNSFKEFQNGLDLLLKNTIPFIVKGTLFPDTIAEMDDFIAWAAEIPAMKVLPSFAMFLEKRHRRDSEKKNERIADLRINPAQALQILAMKPDVYQSEMRRFCKTFIGVHKKQIFNCNKNDAICVDAYGKIQFCLGLRHPDTTFDSRTFSLKDVLQEQLGRLRQITAKDPQFLQRCAKCFLRGLCEQCPVKSWTEHGTLDTPVEYVCQVAHEQAIYLGLLKKGEKSWEVIDWEERLARFTNGS